jgi:hypothetical protein
MAAEVERYEALVRLLKEDRVNVREVKWQKPWSDGCVCVSDPSKDLQRGLERLRQRHAAEDTVGRVRRWVIAVLWLSVFAGIVAGIAYGVSRTVD